MTVLVLLASAAYMLVDVKFESEKLFWYAMKIRAPKLMVMLITAFAIGGASIVFQSIINNTIVTPCLLGMNSLYTLIHTGVVFFVGSGSLLASNPNVIPILSVIPSSPRPAGLFCFLGFRFNFPKIITLKILFTFLDFISNLSFP